MQISTLAALLLAAVATTVLGQRTKPVVERPESTRAYTTALTIDGGGMRCLIPSIVAVEIEESIKRYLVDHPEYLPEDEEIETADDFDVLLADYFDSMSGVSGGSWTTAYLSSKGGNGAAEDVLSSSRIVRRYGEIRPGQARGLEVFFLEYGYEIYPGGINLNVTAPAIPLQNLSADLFNLSDPTTSLATAAGFLPGIEIPGLNQPAFPSDGLEEALELFLGDVKLSELNTFYVLHAYDLIQRNNVYFVHDTVEEVGTTFTSAGVIRSRPRRTPRNIANEQYTPDTNVTEHDFYMRDLTRGSSALPGLQEAKIVNPVDEEDVQFTLVDGATITNNPALQTVIFLTTEPRSIPLSEIALISLGSGIAVQDLSQNVDASTLGWLLNNALIGIVADGGAEDVQQQVDFLFYGNPDVRPGQYLRIQTTAPLDSEEGDALSRATEPADLPVYQTIGQEVVETYRRAIDRFVADFIFAE